MTTAQGLPAAHADQDARLAGGVLIALALLSILAMAHHPTAGSHDSAALAAEIAEKSTLSRTVHGVLIAFMCVELWAFVVFCRRIGFERGAVSAGLVAYTVGTGAMIGAALISGFVVSTLGAHYAQHAEDYAVPFVDLARFAMTGNQALANLGAVAMSAAILLWSIALRHARTGNRWIALLGVPIGALPALALLFGFVHLDVRGMMLVVVCQAAWIIAVGAQMVRGAL